jgi:hypothetical protein
MVKIARDFIKTFVLADEAISQSAKRITASTRSYRSENSLAPLESVTRHRKRSKIQPASSAFRFPTGPRKMRIDRVGKAPRNKELGYKIFEPNKSLTMAEVLDAGPLLKSRGSFPRISIAYCHMSHDIVTPALMYIEDAFRPSVNYLAHGAERLWLGIRPSHTNILEAKVRESFFTLLLYS